MSTSARPPASKTPKGPVKRKRKPRTRPTPRFLRSEEMEAMAQRRCLMILSVLSGEKSVTEAIAEAKITRTHYYHLERKALEAMAEAMVPSPPGKPPEASTAIQKLEEENKRLERERRRSERLLHLTRKLLKPGPVKTKRGGRRNPTTKPTTKPTTSKKTSTS